MNSFALYRLPHGTRCTLMRQTQGLPRQLSAMVDLSGEQGFVVAPFAADSNTPLLVIHPDEVLTMPCDDIVNAGASTCDLKNIAAESLLLQSKAAEDHDVPTRADYGNDFMRFHRMVASGNFRKVVLSRCDVRQRGHGDNPLALFCRACQLYPRLFIALVFSPQSGMWLTATPEILLEGDGPDWHTIALAGTMRLEDSELEGEGEQARWSAKNIEEQRLVATYITEQLQPLAAAIHEEGPRTVRAANLVHLRSDFTFHINNNVRVGDLLQVLHPTPAICGLPKADTFRFIIDNEHTPRQYYSGFMGPVGMHHTRLYVSLRCMQITNTAYRMYAGGGLLRDSIEEQEWLETEAKLETMRRLKG